MIVGVKYATYLISFINTGIREVDKTDPQLDEIIAENVSTELETQSAIEQSLLKILQMWNGIAEPVALGEKWEVVLVAACVPLACTVMSDKGAPAGSVTLPVTVLCACALRTINGSTKARNNNFFMECSFKIIGEN